MFISYSELVDECGKLLESEMPVVLIQIIHARGHSAAYHLKLGVIPESNDKIIVKYQLPSMTDNPSVAQTWIETLLSHYPQLAIHTYGAFKTHSLPIENA